MEAATALAPRAPQVACTRLSGEAGPGGPFFNDFSVALLSNCRMRVHPRSLRRALPISTKRELPASEKSYAKNQKSALAFSFGAGTGVVVRGVCCTGTA